MMLSVRDLSFSVQGRNLLAQIRMDLAPGELLVVVGRNGAGKSTLLKHLTRDLPVTSGEIQLHGQPLEAHKPKDLARQRAVLPQHTQLDFAYAVHEVVMLGRIPHQRRHAETPDDRRIVSESLARVGLAGYEERNYLTLSGGEQQRVHLARALAQLEGTEGDRLLLLDEPTSSLDLAHQHQILMLAREFASQGVGILAILHDLNLAAQYADRILVLAGGKVLAYGTPFEVLTPEVIDAAFGHPVVVMRHPQANCPLVVSLPEPEVAHGDPILAAG